MNIFKSKMIFPLELHGYVIQASTQSQAKKSTGLRIVEDVRTLLKENTEYIYIPDLSAQGRI